MTTDPRPLSAEAPLSASEEVEVRERARLGSVVWVGMRVPRIFATLDAERARHEDTMERAAMARDLFTAERARLAALVREMPSADHFQSITDMHGQMVSLEGPTVVVSRAAILALLETP